MGDIPIPADDSAPPDDDLRRRAIPVDTPQEVPAIAARPIPGTTEDLESRVRPMGRPIPTEPAQPPAVGSTEDLEARSLANAEHPKSAPIQTGVASLWTKAENIHNPVLRVLGEIGAGGARALDVGAQAAGKVIPAIGGIERTIPGTAGNEQVKERQQAVQDAQQASLAKEGAETSKATAEGGEATARGNLAQAQADVAKNPKPDKPETPQQVLAGITAEDLDKGQDPNKDPRVQQVSDTITGIQPEHTGKPTPLTADQAKQRNAIWNPILTKNHLPVDVFTEGMSDADAKEVATQLNNATGKTQAGVKIDLGEGKAGKAEDTKLRTEVGKIYADPMASAERYNVMTDSLDKAINNHDQQAMLNLLTNHIGMTMGLQKGARITQAILNEAQKSQPWLANIKAKFDGDGYLSGVTLGPQQMKSMVDLGRGRFREDVVKARNLAKYAGAEDDGPERTPSTSTMHYYLDQTGNDVTKAKELAKEDGWTVK